MRGRKMNGVVSILLGLILVVVGTVKTAEASLTWKLTGEVETVGEPLSHIFSIGDSVEYIFTFDPFTPDTDSDPVWGRYINAISTATITVGSYSASIENYGIVTINNSDWAAQPEDLVSYNSKTTETILNGSDLLGSDNRVYTFTGLEGSFQDQDGSPNMLLSDSLPALPDAINSLSTRKTFYVGWQAWTGGGTYLGNGISTTNIQLTDITPVPVPAAVWLFVSGLIGLIGLARRKA